MIVRSPVPVDVGERPARAAEPLRVKRHPELLEPLGGASAELVLAERGEEVAGPGELRDLHRRDSAAAGRLGPRLAPVGDLPRRGHVIDLDELDPLDVADDGVTPHPATLSHSGRCHSVKAS